MNAIKYYSCNLFIIIFVKFLFIKALRVTLGHYVSVEMRRGKSTFHSRGDYRMWCVIFHVRNAQYFLLDPVKPN